jgi:Protein of unknown function (DUF2384)
MNNEKSIDLTAEIIFEYGKEVFNDAKNFTGWLIKTNPALGTVPLELLVEGGQENLLAVQTLLGQIDFGVYV